VDSEGVLQWWEAHGHWGYIIEFELPAILHAGNDFNQPKTYQLACIQPCLILNAGDATMELVECSEMKRTPIFVQIGVVECSIGWVKTFDGWSIIDHSSEWARTVFIPEDAEEQEYDI